MKHFLFMVLFMMASVSGFAQLKVASNGNVAVGTLSTPNSNLSVGGSGSLLYKAYVNGDTKVNGCLNVNAIKLKMNPTDNIYRTVIYPVLDLISNLNPYQYLKVKTIFQTTDYSVVPPPSTGKPFQMNYALDGDDVMTSFPAIAYRDEDNNCVIDQGQLIVVLIQAIKELKAKVDALSPSGNNLMMAPIQTPIGESIEKEELELEASPLSLAQAELFQNSPNPFSERTTIRFCIPDDTHNAFIYIFDMTGRMQKKIPVTSSMDSISINGYELPAGMYFYSLIIGGKEIDTKRMILSK
jgi:hypothetical protein